MKMLSNGHIPLATSERLPLYYRFLQRYAEKGGKRISSSQFSELIQIDSATIRKDLSYFGTLGRKGYGYDVEYLIRFLGSVLKQDELKKAMLVGVGNLGTALLNYNFLKNNNTQITKAYDADPRKIGQKIVGLTVQSIHDLDHDDNRDIAAAILAVPQDQAQIVGEKTVKSGVKGILNFTPIRLALPDDVYIRHIDLSVELQSLIYLLNQKMEENGHR
ncbi:redox-sensing transcriptional repressor Rex [Terrilactibacillus laevilacticus]